MLINIIKILFGLILGQWMCIAWPIGSRPIGYVERKHLVIIADDRPYKPG